VPDTEWLIVHIDAGAIPFVSQLPTVDFGGLNDERLSRGMSVNDAVDYFYSFRPGAVVFTSYDWDKVEHGYQAAQITGDPRFEQYVLMRKYRTTSKKNYYEFVFLRKDLLKDLE
jgi:hypothetical protein